MIEPLSIGYDELFLRLGLAVVLGGVLGIDREARGKAAGLRTHMLICLGASAMTLMGLELYEKIHTEEGRTTGADPIRVISSVIAAIGFLAAGTIIQARGTIVGMTTAANFWLAAIIGMSCGAGYLQIAVIAFGMTFVIVTVLGMVTKRLFPESPEERKGG